MQGDGDGKIYPTGNISKQEAVCLIAKAFYIEKETEYVYADASYDAWAKEYVSAVAKRFALPNSFFNTDLRAPITRARNGAYHKQAHFCGLPRKRQIFDKL